MRALSFTLFALLGSAALAGCLPAEAPDPDDDASVGSDDDSEEGDTWATFAARFFEAYCNDCHDGVAAPQDFSGYPDVADWADSIRCGTASTTQAGCGAWPPAGQFPIGDGPFPDGDERDRLVAWIDAGLPE